MKKIVAIGGGEIKDRETEQIDRRIIELTGKKDPHVLFIPTASGDAETYWEIFNNYYTSLGARPDVLYIKIKRRGLSKNINICRNRTNN
jgi:dipeptidase E